MGYTFDYQIFLKIVKFIILTNVINKKNPVYCITQRKIIGGLGVQASLVFVNPPSDYLKNVSGSGFNPLAVKISEDQDFDPPAVFYKYEYVMLHALIGMYECMYECLYV